MIGAYRQALARLPVALILLLACNCGVASAGSLPSASTDDAMLQKRFCAGPDARGSAALCARLKASGRTGRFMPAGGRLTYASRRPAEGLTSTIDFFGIAVSEITGSLATRHRVTQSVKGVVVTDIVTGGVAGLAGFAIGDVLVEIDQEPIESPDGLARQIEALRGSDADTALLLLYRNYRHQFQVIAIE